MFRQELEGIRSLRSLLTPWSGSMGILALIGLLESVMEAVSISLFVPLLSSLDEGIFGSVTKTWFGELLGRFFTAIPPSNRLSIIALTIFGLVFVRSLLGYGGEILAARIDMRLDHHLRERVLARLLDANMRFVERMEPGKMLNTLEDVTGTTSSAVWTVLGLIVTLSMVVVFVIVLLLLSWKLTLLVALALAGISLFVKRLTSGTGAISQHELDVSQDLSQRALEILKGMRTIRTFGGEDREKERFGELSKKLGRAGFDLQKISGLIEPVTHLLSATVLIIVMLIALTDPGNLPTVLVFMFILYRLQPQVLALDEGHHALVEALPSIRVLTGMLDGNNAQPVHSGPVIFTQLKESIRFDSVSFSYDHDGNWALRDVALEIPRGSRIALVGPSGAGKSTLVNLLLRFYEPQRGSVLVDGVPLPELDLASWRAHIAVVSQDTHIFNDSLRNNIAYGRPETTDEQVVSAARLADAHGFISELPEGYDTMAGDHGVLLSGGQRQRIALARAIIRNADILVLDEATNALDSLSEAVVLDTIQSLGGECTVISIAHRMATIERSDMIVVIENGQITEKGTAGELLKNKALFARLYNLQDSDHPVES